MDLVDPFLRCPEDPEITIKIADGPAAESTRIKASAASAGCAPRMYIAVSSPASPPSRSLV